jgi:PilZ domain
MAGGGNFGNFSRPKSAAILWDVNSEPKLDLRCAVRFPLQLPVAVNTNDKEDKGMTQDISAGGVLIHCGEEYPVGSTIRFSISMPGPALGADHDVLVECRGRVVRSTPVGDRVAVGAIIDEYHISR